MRRRPSHSREGGDDDIDTGELSDRGAGFASRRPSDCALDRSWSGAAHRDEFLEAVKTAMVEESATLADARRRRARAGEQRLHFPGGLGVVASDAHRVTDKMFARAARALASTVLESDFAIGSMYPTLQRIREVSAKIATAVAEVAYEEGRAGVERPADIRDRVRASMCIRSTRATCDAAQRPIYRPPRSRRARAIRVERLAQGSEMC